MPTYLDLAQKLRQEVGASGTGPTAVTSQSGEMKRLVDWINDAYLAVCNLWQDWRFLWSSFTTPTIAAVADYAAPADWAKWDQTTIKIDGEFIDVVEYEATKAYALPAASGKPTTAIILPNGSLRLYPTPDAAYTLTSDYFVAPARMTTNADVPLLPAQFHDIIVARAMIFYANFESAPEVKQAGTEWYAELLDRLEAHQLPNKFGANATSMNDFQMVVV